MGTMGKKWGVFMGEEGEIKKVRSRRGNEDVGGRNRKGKFDVYRFGTG